MKVDFILQILYWPENSSVVDAQTKISPDSHFLLGELDTFTMYYMSVQAYNLAGDGPKSLVVSNRTLEGCTFFELLVIE